MGGEGEAHSAFKKLTALRRSDDSAEDSSDDSGGARFECVATRRLQKSVETPRGQRKMRAAAKKSSCSCSSVPHLPSDIGRDESSR